jgi:two-component system NtrC family response regulator
MFGVERGAFTGAVASRSGRFRAAHQGTLVLDEIGEMDVALQAKLLRVLQDKVVQPVGSVASHRVDVRIIATTNRDLVAAIAEGLFREDLYFRLAVFEIEVPPLRDRPDDVIPLARHFLKEFSPERPRRLAPETEAALRAHPWPGNVRELRNAMERASLLARGGVVRRPHLPAALRVNAERTPTAPGTLQEMERALIVETLATHGGNRSRAAKALGLSRRALYNKLERYGIE